MSVAAVVAIEDGTIASASLAFGGLAPRPWRDAAVEAALIGRPAQRATFVAAADALVASARGYGHNDFKIPLARRTLIGCLRDLTEGAAQ
jgi:xanthine dehydrogenase YagS FAD-binding subunit